MTHTELLLCNESYIQKFRMCLCRGSRIRFLKQFYCLAISHSFCLCRTRTHSRDRDDQIRNSQAISDLKPNSAIFNETTFKSISHFNLESDVTSTDMPKDSQWRQPDPLSPFQIKKNPQNPIPFTLIQACHSEQVVSRVRKKDPKPLPSTHGIPVRSTSAHMGIPDF